MRAMFQSKFPNLQNILNIARFNAGMIQSGCDLYVDFARRMDGLLGMDDEYNSIFDLYESLGITPTKTISKRNKYSFYQGGIVIGAGSGEDCIDIIGDDRWKLFDLTDKRMINKAVGHGNATTTFNMASTSDGDTLSGISGKHKKGDCEIEVIKIDSLVLEGKCELISMDVEGSAIDVLQGAVGAIQEHSPDLLVSIYHNWVEYLLSVPMIYDMGYDIHAVSTSNVMPSQPHLELSLFCTKRAK